MKFLKIARTIVLFATVIAAVGCRTQSDNRIADRSADFSDKNAATTDNRKYSELKSQLETYVAGKDARIGLAIIIDGKDTVSVNGSRDFPMMSVFKFPLALSVAAMIDADGLSLNDIVLLDSGELLEDTYSPMLKKYGEDLTAISFCELLRWALVESDNNAADILLRRVGGTSGSTRLMTRLGIGDGICIGASEEDMHRDPYLSYLNRSTPLAMARLFDKFDTDIRLRSQSFAEVAKMLEQCSTGADRLPAPLAGTNALIGHKTGTGFTTSDGRITALNDCGYIHLPDGTRYSIAVFIADSAFDIAQTSRMIAEISEMVFDFIKGE